MRMKYNRVKHLAACVMLFVCSTYTYAQQSAERAYEGIFPPKRDDGPKRRDRYFIDIFHPKFLQTPTGIKQQWYSWGINFCRMFDVPINKKSTVGFAWGVNFSSEHIYINGKITGNINLQGEARFSFTPFEPSYKYKLHKHVFNYIELPLQLRFRTNQKTNFYFYPGVKAGYMLDHHNKTIDNDGKYKFYSFKGLNRLRYGATLHIGIDRIGFFAYYPLSSIFIKEKGDESGLFCIGISLNAF